MDFLLIYLSGFKLCYLENVHLICKRATMYRKKLLFQTNISTESELFVLTRYLFFVDENLSLTDQTKLKLNMYTFFVRTICD